MNKLKILLTLFIINLFTVSISAQPTLDSLITKALEVSPMLKMVMAKENSAKSSIRINSNLPDPMLSFGVMSLPVGSFSFSEEPMTTKVLGLSQEFPFPGKLSAVENATSKDVEIVKQEYADQRNLIIKDLSRSYYELNYIRKEIELTEESRRLMKDILDVVRSMYSVSQANQQNIFRIDLELTKMAEMISALKSEQKEYLSIINSYLLQDPFTPIASNDFPEVQYINLSVNDLISTATMNRPVLKGILLAEEKEKMNQTIAEYDFYPIFRISAQYGFRGTLQGATKPLHDMLTVMVDLSLPINYGGKVSAMVEETQSMQQMYQEQYSASLQMLNREFGMLTAKLNSLKERINLVENGSAIQAKENFNSALTAYQVGNIDFMNVIEAQDNLYTISKSLFRLKTDYLNQVTELEFLTGTSLKKNTNLNGDK